jgi:hypothetical protein
MNLRIRMAKGGYADRLKPRAVHQSPLTTIVAIPSGSKLQVCDIVFHVPDMLEFKERCFEPDQIGNYFQLKGNIEAASGCLEANLPRR